MFIEDIVFVGGGYAAEMGGKERAEHVEILCSCCHTCNFILVASIRDELREGRGAEVRAEIDSDCMPLGLTITNF